MFYYFYKITNNINGHYYYGVHSTNDINDNYMGSGVRLKYAYKKYGIENFTKTIIKYFDNQQDMYDYEKLIVNEDLINDNNCYNLITGGQSGTYSESSREKNRQTNVINGLLMYKFTYGGAARKGKAPWNKGISHSKQSRQKMKEAALKRDNSHYIGHFVSEETKEKLRKPRPKGKHSHNLIKRHWKLVDGKRIYY